MVGSIKGGSPAQPNEPFRQEGKGVPQELNALKGKVTHAFQGANIVLPKVTSIPVSGESQNLEAMQQAAGKVKKIVGK